MRLLHHHDAPHEDPEPTRQDPVAVAVWRHGLTDAPAAATLVIHAPHAADLVTPAA